MTVKFRERKLKDGKVRLILDCYHKKVRKQEFLDLWLYSEPKTPKEKEHNKSTRILAENIRSKRLLQFQENSYGFASYSFKNASFLNYFEKLTEERKRSPGNHGNWQSAFKILKKFTKNLEVNFSQIDEAFLNNFKHYLLNEKLTKSNTQLSQNSASSYFNKVRAALSQAFDEKLIPENPARRVKGIKAAETHRNFLSIEELKRLAKTDCENAILKKAFMFSALTGLRWSDINNLKWIDLHHSKENGWALQFRQQKTKGVEILPISEQAMDVLPEKGLDTDRVFKGLKYSAWNNLKLAQWIMKAGITKAVTFHCARHTHAGILINSGTHVNTVSKLLGHRDLKTTMIYAKLLDKTKREAVNSFPDIDI